MSKFSKLYKTGFFHIFGGSVFSQIGSFVVNIFVTRMLAKAAYGTYVAAHNMYDYFALFMGLGFVSGIMQYCSEKVSLEKKSLYYRYSIRVGTATNILIAILILAFSVIVGRKDPEQGRMLAALSGLCLVTYFSNFNHSVLRINKKNKQFAYANMLSVLLNVTFNLVVTRLIGVYGIIIAAYLTQGTNALISQYFINKHCPHADVSGMGLEKSEKRQFVKFSVVCCLTNLTSSLLILMDITCVDLILNNPELTATYKIAATIPAALMFIPQSYITYVYPLLAERNRDVKAMNKLIGESVGMLALINGAITLVLFVAAPLVVDILWGAKYADAVPTLRILLINFFIFGTFRKILGNVILVIRKVEVNFINTLTSGILNTVLNIVLIHFFSSKGAAIATVLVSIFTTMFSLVYYIYYIKSKSQGLQES